MKDIISGIQSNCVTWSLSPGREKHLRLFENTRPLSRSGLLSSPQTPECFRPSTEVRGQSGPAEDIETHWRVVFHKGTYEPWATDEGSTLRGRPKNWELLDSTEEGVL